MVRSLTHRSNDHTVGHYFMLTGRSVVNPGFRGDRQARPTDWPSIASISETRSLRGPITPSRDRAARAARSLVGRRDSRCLRRSDGCPRDPFFIEASPYGNPFWRGPIPSTRSRMRPRNHPRAPTTASTRRQSEPVTRDEPRSVTPPRRDAQRAGPSARRSEALGDVVAFRPPSPVGYLSPRLPRCPSNAS